MTHTSEIAAAKINLFLHITGRRADGYHELDSLVVFTPDIADHLIVSPDTQSSLHISGPFADKVPSVPSPDTLFGKTLALFGAITHQTPQVRIELHKNLPVAAGIGGGSADAAALLRGLCRLYKCPERLPDLQNASATIGADIPVCLNSQPARMQGIGEILTLAPKLPEMYLVLINPNTPVETGQVFNAHKQANTPFHPTIKLPTAFSSAADLCQFLNTQTHNSLAPAATKICPAIEVACQALTQTGASLTRMSGSGATCFGIFEKRETAEAAANKIRTAHSNWWVEVSN